MRKLLSAAAVCIALPAAAGSGHSETFYPGEQVRKSRHDLVIPERHGEFVILRIVNGNDSPLNGIHLRWQAEKHVLILSSAGADPRSVPEAGGNPVPHFGEIESMLGEYALPENLPGAALQEEAEVPDFFPAPQWGILTGSILCVLAAAALAALAAAIVRSAVRRKK